MCEGCGAVLDQVVARYGDKLTMLVDEAQREAGPREITTPQAATTPQPTKQSD